MYLGPEFTNTYIQKELFESDYDYQELNEQILIEFCVNDLISSRVVGWFQGRMEWGQRALGDRSILADPRKGYIVDVINTKTKMRETFRPFAPSILLEYVDEYFEYPKGIDMSYMLYLARAKANTMKIAPAIVHVDGTARIQTVSYDMNPLYWKLISTFNHQTGVPMVLNTSFNMKGEPIVATVEDALRCFGAAYIDVLYMQNFRVTKKGG